MEKFFFTYLAAVNLAAFAAMGIDKAAAKRNGPRIREVTLFLLCIMGGSIGGSAGMWLFRHKTRHLSFRIGFPAILLLHLALAAVLRHSVMA